ncbi:MAG: Asp23/Gls24 family envelope stress response protein [Chloroflexi bacterium]|nr:MAG: Asp23/Gls24 family envelope stress response protein [Chloroflexota bacterium]MBL1196391.1 Asp23/Gls24 family envelope stress response protein [Chloroflexota bacterium]NOH13686.1 Asp23/Gls24 family envelope stress response protein [Chloroflexota bacterium]
MSDTNNPYGSVNVSPKAIATIAYHAAIESYGVVGLASKNLVNGLTHMIVRDPAHGIEVDFKEDEINIDLYIVVQYGTRIKSVASSVANTVRYNVEKSLGLPLNEINVHVQGLRFNEEEN